MVNLDAGSYFVHEGCPLDGIAIVGKGRLRVYKSSSSGREITLYEVRAGQLCLLNVLAMLTGAPAPASARVEEQVTALLVPNDRFRGWIGTEAALRNYVLGVVAGGVVDVMSLVEEIAFKKLDVRLAEYLCQNLIVGPGQARELKVTHEAIAAELGSAREVISRLLKEFERQGAVVLGRGRLAMADRATLEALAAH
ncbi:Crp/Fnr family transcriptional regulator [bacterium]|nr:Crp/Fnr family transcriptional regulator [bacterium]